MVIVVTEKHQKLLLYSGKIPFLVVEFINTVTFGRNARFDIILTSVSIIKQMFSSQIVSL